MARYWPRNPIAPNNDPLLEYQVQVRLRWRDAAIGLIRQYQETELFANRHKKRVIDELETIFNRVVALKTNRGFLDIYNYVFHTLQCIINLLENEREIKRKLLATPPAA
ncbi:unnamed protein product [Caenorhabditis angaria]|uniref:Uncharacterized protein n=1 Tax=Caenorhabditis angaria TaxID=860376 RepID=A0A9P1J1V5_9PELO|nr:unnamed protein product [Caenorhabditis angaria]